MRVFIGADNMYFQPGETATTWGSWREIPNMSQVDAKAAISGQAFSGNISAPNLSGTNTGDQTLSEIGVGQTWQDLTASRAMDVTYTNSTGKPIFVSIYSPGGTDANALVVDGIVVAKASDSDANTTTVYAIVPNNSTYHRPSGSGVDRWTELR
jgi:hypothetical protein